MWHPQWCRAGLPTSCEGRVDLIDLSDEDQEAINAELAARLRPAGEA